jgi:hypothetical protein
MKAIPESEIEEEAEINPNDSKVVDEPTASLQPRDSDGIANSG